MPKAVVVLNGWVNQVPRSNRLEPNRVMTHAPTHNHRLPRILLADDQPVYLAEMAELLRSTGYDCQCVSDARLVEDELSRGTVDVLVADIRMPGNFNLELVERVRSSEDAPAVILMTGFPTLETAINSVKLKICAYLVKPFGFNELLSEVQNALLSREALASGPGMSVPESGQSGIMQVGSAAGLLERHPEVERLTRREYEVFLRVLMGDDVPAIGASLFISPHTVRNHLKAIYRKLDVRSRVELVVRYGPVPRQDIAAQS